MSIDNSPRQSQIANRAPKWDLEDVDDNGYVPQPPEFALPEAPNLRRRDVRQARLDYDTEIRRGIVELEGMWDADSAAPNHIEVVRTARQIRETYAQHKKVVTFLGRHASEAAGYSPKHV